ncbi:MAG: hypothetical protein AB1556_03125 [Bacillota bacterium]
MLERHYELAREMKLYEKIAIDELSIDDISYYLKLRREYEELQNQVVNLIPSVLEKIKNLFRQAQEKLAQLSAGDLGDCVRQTNYPFLKELVEVTGELEADVEKVVARCSRLGEIVRQNQEGDLPQVPNNALAEAACAREAGEVPVIREQEKQEMKNESEQKVMVSPDTIKKIEMMVRPKETVSNSLLKIAPPHEARNRPAKSGKDRGKR